MSFVPGWGGISPGAGGGGIVPQGGGGAWGSIAGRLGGLGEYGYSMPSFQGEISVGKVAKPPTQGISPTMPYQFTTKQYVDYEFYRRGL